MSEWKEFREELMQDPDVKAAYDAHAPEREIARALIAQRIAANVTQKEMADKMNVPQGNISRMESGKRTPTIATLQKAARALNVPLEIRFVNQVVYLSKGKA